MTAKAERASAETPLDDTQSSPVEPSTAPEATPQEKGRAKAKADAVKKKASAQTAPKSAPSASHTAASDTPAYSETPAYRQGKVHARQRIEAAKDTTQKTIKTAKRAERTVKQTAKSTGKATVKTAKGTIKTSQKAIKTAETTSKTAIKTSKAAAQAAQKTAVATARAARATVAAAKAAAKAAVVAAKVIAKATVAAVKAIIAGVKALVAAIAAGGWVAVLVIVIICLIALIVGSCFGIFFSSEDAGSNQTMQQVVQEINEEYLLEIDNIKYSVDYDELEMSGARAVWPEVLAIYAVKTTTDPDNPQEVASITDEKIELLRDIFWAMNDIDYRTDTFTDTEIVESDDGNGNIVEEEVEVTKTYLYITVSHIQNVPFLNSLPHGIYMERSLDGLTFGCLSNNGSKGFKSLSLGCCGESEEGLVVMTALADNCIYILVSQIHFIFFDTGFLGICKNRCGSLWSAVHTQKTRKSEADPS